jgi:hypothetical protein
MIPRKRGPNNKTLFQTEKVIVAVNLTGLTVMTRHALYTDFVMGWTKFRYRTRIIIMREQGGKCWS